MKKVKMLYLLVLVLALLCIFFPCLFEVSAASAAVYSEGGRVWGQLYEDYKNSGSGASIYKFKDLSYGGITYVIPIKNSGNCDVVATCSYTAGNDTYSVKSYSNLIYPALWKNSDVCTLEGFVYNCSGICSSGHPDEGSYIYYADIGGITNVSYTLRCPVITRYAKQFYVYCATGEITDLTDIDVELPDGWNLDEDGRPVEGQGDTIFSETFNLSFAHPDRLWGILDGQTSVYEGSTFEKTVHDGYDKRMCFYKECLLSCVGNDASCLYVYTEKSSSNPELIRCVADLGIDPQIFADLSHSSSSSVELGLEYDIGGMIYLPVIRGSHGGGHFGDDVSDSSEVVIESFYSKGDICSGYPVVVNGLFCLQSKSDYNLNLLAGFDELMSRTVIGSTSSSASEYANSSSIISSIKTPDISRPVFSSKEAAAEWYQTSIVEDYHNDIVYKPSGYYYHKSTKILDTNPDGNDTSNDDEKDNNPFESSPGTDPTPVEPVNTVVSGSTVVVNVTQSNDNSYDSHDKITASATATASAIVNNNTGNESGGMMELPDSDDESLFDVIGDAVDDEDDDWLNLIKYAFGFLPEKIQTILNGSVIVSIIVGLLRRR